MDYSKLTIDELTDIIEKRFGEDWTLDEVDEKDKALAMAYFAFLEDIK